MHQDEDNKASGPRQQMQRLQLWKEQLMRIQKCQKLGFNKVFHVCYL